MTAAAHKVEAKDGLTHDERMALRDDVERVREVLLAPTSPPTARARVAVYACGPADLLEVVRLRRPVENKVVLDRTAFVEPLVLHGTDERWLVLLTNRRAARLFFGPGDALEETDRFVDDVHSEHQKGGWSQSNYQRSVEKEVTDHLANAAELAFDALQEARRRPRPGRRAGRAAGRVQGQAAPVPARADRRADLRRRRERVAGRRVRGAAEPLIIEHVAQAASARRWTGWRRASAPAGAARRASPRCSTRSTRRAWRRC